MAIGDFNHDQWGDIAVGVPGEDVGSITDAGAVNVIYFVDIFNIRGTLWCQDSIHDVAQPSNAADPPEASDQFGYSLATGDFDCNGYDDLAIGTPFEDHSGLEWDSGLVQVLFGLDANGLSDTKNALIFVNQGSGNQEAGYALAAGDFDIDGCDDLAIGLPTSASSGHTRDGSVYLLYGNGFTADGFRDSDDWEMTQGDLPAVAAEDDDQFGSVLTILPSPPYRLYLPCIFKG